MVELNQEMPLEEAEKLSKEIRQTADNLNQLLLRAHLGYLKTEIHVLDVSTISREDPQLRLMIRVFKEV